MFERYVESARRVLFFARYEVSELGATSIEPEHILLGLIRDRVGLVSALLSYATAEAIRRDVVGRSEFREKTSTSVEIPFSKAAKRALVFAAEEADGLQDRNIAPEHLLLGLMREEGSVAASVLAAQGLRLDELRGNIVAFRSKLHAPAQSDADSRERIERANGLLHDLSLLATDSSRAHYLVQRIQTELEALRHLPGSEAMSIATADQLIELAEAYDRCWVEGRPEDLRRYLHPDAVFTGPNFQRLTKGVDACVQSYVKFLAAARIHDFKTSEFIVDLAGESAAMTYRWTIDYEFGGTRSVETGWDLLVWIPHDDRWVIFWRNQRADAA